MENNQFDKQKTIMLKLTYYGVIHGGNLYSLSYFIDKWIDKYGEDEKRIQKAKIDITVLNSFNNKLKEFLDEISFLEMRRKNIWYQYSKKFDYHVDSIIQHSFMVANLPMFCTVEEALALYHLIHYIQEYYLDNKDCVDAAYYEFEGFRMMTKEYEQEITSAIAEQVIKQL